MEKNNKIIWPGFAAVLLLALVSMQAAESAKSANMNAITGAAAKSGIDKCLGRIDQVTGFVTADSQSGAYLFVSPDQPDSSLVSASMEVQAKNALAYSSASFAPVGSGGCSGMYEAVTYWAENCDIVGSRGFPQLKKTGVIQRHIQILQGEGTIRLFLMPAGQGCISIKKEVIF